MWLLGLACLVTLALQAALHWRGQLSTDRPGRWQVRPLTAYPGMEYAPALSPDGSMVAFSWQGEVPDEGSPLDLYVMQVEDGTPVRLTADSGSELFAAWSPDGTTIAFARGMIDAFEICTVPVLGGRIRRLLTVESAIGGLDWSPDGRTIAYSAHGASSTDYRIHLLALDTVSSRLLDVEHVPGEVDISPAFSPDGRTVAFIRILNVNQHEILLAPLAGGEVKELRGVKGPVSGLAWASDHEIVVSAASLIDYDLWLADVETGERTWLTIPGRPAISPTIASGGSRLVYGELAYDCDIYRIDLLAAGGIDQSQEPLIASTRMEYGAVYSPDGTRIALVSDRSGRYELWIADADGSNPWRLTDEVGSYLMSPSWSPDGKRIAFSAMPDDQLCIYVSDVEARIARRLSAARRHEVLMHWSSSGEWLYYRVQSDDAWEVWRRRPDNSHEEQLTDVGYTIIGEAGGGTEFVCRKDGDPGIWRLPAGGGKAELIVPGEVAKNWMSVAAVDHGLYYLRQGADSACLGFYELATLQSDSLGVVPLISGFLRVSPDGSRLLYDSTMKVEIDLMLAEIID